MRFASGQSERRRRTAEEATSYTAVGPAAPARLSDDPDCKAIHDYGDGDGDGFELMVLNLLLGMVMGMAQPIHCSACFMKVIGMVICYNLSIALIH